MSAEHELEKISKEIRYKASIGCMWTILEIEERHRKNVIDALIDSGFIVTRYRDDWKYLVKWNNK